MLTNSYLSLSPKTKEYVWNVFENTIRWYYAKKKKNLPENIALSIHMCQSQRRNDSFKVLYVGVCWPQLLMFFSCHGSNSFTWIKYNCIRHGSCVMARLQYNIIYRIIYIHSKERLVYVINLNVSHYIVVVCWGNYLLPFYRMILPCICILSNVFPVRFRSCLTDRDNLASGSMLCSSE